ncbi:prepilin peptidase [Aestuariicella hydrocarbonica]|uniref:Protein translocase subunit SecA n=1 Tax=Pseudomaricurvus hydrocarbonicus TaxID=1470433 RepID=A0A9E5JT47_9GAMM|nr:DEAD/DEAH box helicase [Aestuariicella hydrocarbonica]NHO66318.1 prepilin peptidase [Aestuariicella hydrocarbonica]
MSSASRSGRSPWPARHAVSVALRPERDYYTLSWLDRYWRALYSRCLWPLPRLWFSPGRLARKIITASDVLQPLDEAEFQQHLLAVRQRLVREGIQLSTLVMAFAAVREAAGRSLGMRHHHTQIRASLIMLRGMVAEMATGEGKTLACTLASCTAAMAGIKVHVVTTNDYLAERDCEEMLPLFHYLGLSAGALNSDTELPQRQKIYHSDILYSANNELVFDYLKDLLVLGERRQTVDVYRDSLTTGAASITGQLMHQGLVFAIVDEADSVFIDESRTPLVISGGDLPQADSEDFLRQIMSLAQTLEEGRQYEIAWQQRRIILLPAGRQGIETLAESAEAGMSWLQRARSEELLVQALTALHLFQRDKHYIVGVEPGSDDDESAAKVMIVDDYTGRLAADRSWEGGLHQLIEIKEDCELTQPQKTLAKISYQQFFRKYFYLSGMTGTAREVKDEFYSVYGLLVYKVPLLRKSRRRLLRYRVYPTMAAKEQAIIAAVQKKIAAGQAVLVGTATVDQSERLAQQLQAAEIEFELLTAKQDADEAGVVARAGQSGRVTLATSMAGRGTDIKLTAQTREAGGLHVIICELQDASRIDRQLEGRGARQGDPGSVEYLLSFDDPLVQVYGRKLYRLLQPLFFLPYIGHWCGRRLQRYCQWQLERKHARERRMTQKNDEQEKKTLAFLGDGKWG